MTHARQLTLGLEGPARAPDVFAIGHSNRPIERFLALLRHHAIAHVADVRSIPYSRRHPQFSREPLRAALAAAGIGYSHWPDLGGRREASAGLRSYADYAATPPFAAALARLESEAARTRLAFMCAEADIRQCHRQYIAAALAARGQAVHPIVDADLGCGPAS
jgi:uncharacterized protein (DUF488 family)